jgi:TonB-linked SusC/RagA family outer membrane protein
MRTLLRSVLLVLLLIPVPLIAQQREVSGRVLGPEGQPVPLATVAVVGASIATTTNELGAFRIRVPSGPAQLAVQSIGYRATVVDVGANQAQIEIRLDTDVLNLDAIVVTGQATSVARRNLANAVSTVTPQQIETAPPAASVEKVMQGQMPGAYIEQNSGAPGGGIQVRLRGVSTLIGESEPLWVIDGVMVSNVAIASNANEVSRAAGGSNPSLTQDNLVNRITDINPNDIERIEVLKGASAAALYGSRAANGVILITTKRGQPGRTQISLTQRFGFFDLSNKFGFREWTRDEAVDAFGESAGAFFNANGTPLVQQDMEELIAGRNDLSHETSASMSGGDANTRYFLSGTWKTDEGVVTGTFFDKQSARLRMEQRLGSRITVDASANLIHTLSDRGLTNNDNSGTSYYMVFPFTPSFAPLQRQEDGTFPANPFERSNPLETASLMSNDEEVWRVLGSGSASWTALETETQRLQVRGTVGVDFFQQKNDLLFPAELQFEPADGLPGTSLLSNSDNRDITAIVNLIHGYRGGTYSLTTTGGIQWENRELNTARISARGLTGGQRSRASGVVKEVGEFRSAIRDLGLFVQEEALMLDERLLLTAGLRADRSSVNAQTDEYSFYPKAAASYRFDAPLPSVNALKVRAAWGQSGNQPQYGQKFTPLTATSNIDGLPGLIVDGTVAAEDLRPERQSEVEAGIDLTLFDSRAQFEVTGFRKTITDLLLLRTPAPSTGFTTEIFNGGELVVDGLEMALTAEVLRTDDFNWFSHTTFTRDYSKIEDLPVPSFEVGGFGTGLGAFRIENGASATQIVGTVGFDEDGVEIVQKIGDATPTFRMGFTNDFRWRSLTLTSLFDWSHGNSVINLTRLLADAGSNTADFVADPATCPGVDLDGDGTDETLGTGECRILTWAVGGDIRPFVEDASYVKLRELSLAWDLPAALTASLFGGSIGSASLTLSGRDLLTFTDYSGLDPEVSNFGNQPVARNIDVAPYPPSRSFWAAVHVTF